MGSAEDEARERAIKLYRIIAAIQLTLGVGLLICGGFGTQYISDSEFGPPYFVGGFVVGSMMLVGGALCAAVGVKGSQLKAEEKSREVACCVLLHYILSMFIFMGCFLGIAFAGMGSCETSTWSDTDCPTERDTIRYCIIAGICLALVTNIVGMCLVCTNGGYFGVVMRRGARGRTVLAIDTSSGATQNSTSGTFGTATMFQTNTGDSSRIQQLQRENELLQKQLELQGQLKQQQQRQVGFGISAPAPAPANYGLSTDPVYPPPTAFP